MYTALMLGAAGRHFDACLLLIEAGADVNHRSSDVSVNLKNKFDCHGD